MDTIIAIDIGGTHIRCALFPLRNDPHITIKKIRTQGKKTEPGKPIERLISCIKGAAVEISGYILDKVACLFMVCFICLHVHNVIAFV